MHTVIRPFFRPAILGLLALMATATGEARAQNCTGGTVLSATEVSTLLSNRYACGASGGQTWNELHSGSSIIDYKLGPNDPKDPSTTVGTFNIGGTSTGQVTYVYANGGGTYAYQIRAGGASATTTPGTYSYCGVNGAGNFSITVSNTPCSAP